MKNNKVFLLIFLIFLVRISFAQNVVINELDCDTPGIDNKEFVELRSLQPNFPLDGYSLVFLMGQQMVAIVHILPLTLMDIRQISMAFS